MLAAPRMYHWLQELDLLQLLEASGANLRTIRRPHLATGPEFQRADEKLRQKGHLARPRPAPTTSDPRLLRESWC